MKAPYTYNRPRPLETTPSTSKHTLSLNLQTIMKDMQSSPTSVMQTYHP